MKFKFFMTACMLCLLFSGISLADITEGLISYWPLDEGQGTYTQDMVSSNDGVLLKGSSSDDYPTWIIPGKLGGSHLLFTSGTTWTGPEPHSVLLNSDGVVDSGNINPELMPTTAISISAWVKPDDFVYYASVFFNSQWTGSALSGYSIHTYNDTFNWWVKPDGGDYGIISFPGNTGHWYHLTGTYDSTLPNQQMKLYVNGQLEGVTNLSGDIDYDPLPFNCLIGAYNDDNENHEFLGQIDDVGIWNRALSLSEVQWLYNYGDGHAILEPQEPNSLLQEAVDNIWGAIAQKTTALAAVQEVLVNEQEAYNALSEMLDIGDYGDLTEQDITKAMKKLEISIAEQQRVIDELQDSIFWLERVQGFLEVKEE